MSQIFISYSNDNSDVADEIAQALERGGFDYWIDKKALRLGESIVARINEGIAGASYVVFLASATSLASRWVSMEWMAALAKDDTVVIPVILEQCQLPPLLRPLLSVDLTSDRLAGIERLVRFFEEERSPVGRRRFLPARRGEGRGSSVLRKKSRRILRLVATRCLGETDLSAFLYDCEIPPGLLAGNSLHERILCLLHSLESEGIRQDFADWLHVEKGPCVEKALGDLERETARSWTKPDR